MSKTDPLQAFFDATQAPAIDGAFRMRVMEAVAARRLRVEIAASGLAGLVVFLVLLLLRPALEILLPDLATALQGTVMILAVIALAIYAGNSLLTRPMPFRRWVVRFL